MWAAPAMSGINLLVVDTERVGGGGLKRRPAQGGATWGAFSISTEENIYF